MRRDGPPPDHWTPALVEGRLIEAVRFLRHLPDRAGPQGYKSAMPHFRPTLEDFLEEGWGLPDPPDDDEEPPPRLTAGDVQRMLEALAWVPDLLAPDQPEIARALNAWVFAQAHDRPFKKVIRQRGLSRTRAYGMRDRGLAIISVKLARKGVEPCPARS